MTNSNNPDQNEDARISGARSGSRSRRRWLRLLARVLRLLVIQPQSSSDLVRRSYDKISNGYDDVWTRHMRDLSLAMLEELDLPGGGRCVDLNCGTGFVAGELAKRTAGHVVGVDRSSGMLACAERSYGDRCDFVEADSVEYLRSLRAESVDVVTCAWGLGYARPFALVREAGRVLRRGGVFAVIDNSTFSLWEVLWSSMLMFAERPEALAHALKVGFLPNSLFLAALMRMHGFGIERRGDGCRTYHVPSGREAVERMIATGAAAGFEYAAASQHQEWVFERFAEIHEGRCCDEEGVAVTHRYLTVVGTKR